MTAERRRSVRRRPDTNEALSWARLRTGTELGVLNISDHGALVESRTRLLPGTHVDLHLMTSAGRVLQRAKVARAFVGRLDAPALSYHVAVAFDARVDTSLPRVATTRDIVLVREPATPQLDLEQPLVMNVPTAERFTAGSLAPVLEPGPRRNE